MRILKNKRIPLVRVLRRSSKIKEERAEGLYKEDRELPQRKSHLNASVKKLYDEFLESPNSHKAHELLHTYYKDRRKDCYISVGQ